MKLFIKRLLVFVLIPFFIVLIAFLLPPTPKAKRYYLSSKKDKDSLMSVTGSPRIIFLGGSNIVFGMNSELIKDSLSLNPINAGLSATVGLKFMMDNALNYVREGDIVIIAAEYQQFYKNFAFGGQDLVRLVADYDFKSILFLTKDQLAGFAKNSPDYILSKFNPQEYFLYHINPAYDSNIFNEFGDSSAHWRMEPRDFSPSQYFEGNLNFNLIQKMIEFEKALENKRARLFLSYPCYQKESFEINEGQIKNIEKEIIKRGFDILGTPERYIFEDDFMFDTPYHLTAEGVNRRTSLLIEDLREKL
jgi:hypothetical protein